MPKWKLAGSVPSVTLGLKRPADGRVNPIGWLGVCNGSLVATALILLAAATADDAKKNECPYDANGDPTCCAHCAPPFQFRERDLPCGHLTVSAFPLTPYSIDELGPECSWRSNGRGSKMRRRKRSFRRDGAKRHIPRRRRREAVGYKGCEAGRKAPHKSRRSHSSVCRRHLRECPNLKR